MVFKPATALRMGHLRYNPKGRYAVPIKTQLLIYLALLALLDALVPIPITAMILIMVLFQKPRWFKEWVEKVYRS